jgi:hypothetical protein
VSAAVAAIAIDAFDIISAPTVVHAGGRKLAEVEFLSELR